MDDRKLLELAAKAAGVIKCEPYRWYGKVLDGLWVDFGEGFGKWNPLEDDGDALRLAVSLGMAMDANVSRVAISNDIDIVEVNQRDNASMRRAIVRAAAEIGKSM